MKYTFEADRLAYWYLRLNGFLTIENFILHDETGGGQRTDIDIVAIRLPYRREALKTFDNSLEWMTDDPAFENREKPLLVFAEITAGQCKLNGPWTSREKQNIPRALRAICARGL